MGRGRLRYRPGYSPRGKISRRYNRLCSDIEVYDLHTGKLLRIERNPRRPGRKSQEEQRMKELLDELLAGHEYVDNVRPAWLNNPKTGAPLELDRYYPDLGLAFEYQGKQHYSSRYHRSERHFREQQERDRMKAEIAKQRGIVIVYVTRRWLSLPKLYRKIRRALDHRPDLLARLEQPRTPGAAGHSGCTEAKGRGEAQAASLP